MTDDAKTHESRTIGFFLTGEENEPDGDIIEICEVIAVMEGETPIVRGNCSVAAKNKNRCKHTRAVAEVYQATNGHFIASMPGVTPEQIAAAMRSPEEYRELLLHRGRVQVV